MIARSVRTGLVLLNICIFGWSVIVPTVSAQNVNTPACLTQTYDALAHEKRLYRSVLFGQKKSGDLPKGSVRFDIEGNTWIKKDINSWRSLDDSFKNTTWSDGLMDDRADVPARRGILEIKKTPTSDLIPAITQAFRAYQCRLQSVCGAALQSQSSATGATTLTINTDGCIELAQPVLSACKNNTQLSAGPDTCLQIIDSMLDQEEQALVLLVSYDASYRTVVQFTGMFEGFLTDFRFPLIEPLWQTVRAIGNFSNIPCFIGQCDE